MLRMHAIFGLIEITREKVNNGEPLTVTRGGLVAEWLACWTQAQKGGGAENASSLLENASMEKASTKQRISQGWKTHVPKTQVRKMQVQCKPSVR